MCVVQGSRSRRQEHITNDEAEGGGDNDIQLENDGGSQTGAHDEDMERPAIQQSKVSKGDANIKYRLNYSKN